MSGEYIFISEMNKTTIGLNKLMQFLIKNCTQDKVMLIHNSLFFQTQIITLRLIVVGHNIWSLNANTKLEDSVNLYRYHYPEFPTNFQFTERGVKESG